MTKVKQQIDILPKRLPPSNAEVMEHALADEGFITVRLNPQVYNTRAKCFVGLKGQSISFKVPNQANVDLALNKIEAALRSKVK